MRMDRELVTTETTERVQPRRVLLTPRPTPARTGTYYQRLAVNRDIQHILKSVTYSKYLAVDYETKGNDYSSSDIEIVGVALAWDKGSAYIPFTEVDAAALGALCDTLLCHPGLLAHNVYFDGGVTHRVLGCYPKDGWHACTLALYRLLSNEGWAGQTYGLKDAMRDILQWPETNEIDLDTWLVTHGYYKGNPRKDDSPEVLLRSYQEGHLKPEKGEMWRAPTEILGKYSVLDAEACYLLYTEHLLPVLQQFPELQKSFHQEWMYLIDLHIWQKVNGIHMDRPALFERQIHLRGRMHDLEQQFRNHPEVRNHILEMEYNMICTLRDKEPERYKKKAPAPKEPVRLRKDGTVSKSWTNWVERYKDWEATPLEVSKTWLAWADRTKLAMSGQDLAYRFNIQSGPQMIELLYTRLGHEVRLTTDSGLPGTGTKALKHMGEVGAILVTYEELAKELGFIDKYLELTETRPTIHPSFSVPGPCTGRLSSSRPNLQQVPKTKAMMDLFIARPGYTWIDLDFSALEPVVATEFSGDKNMMHIYGDDVPPNDIYLFVAAHIPGMGEKVRATGYDPYVPTKDTLGRAKKECKHIRSIAKTVVLACQYGAGVDKILSTLENDNIVISREEVEKVWRTYWDLFSGVKDFSRELEREWKRSGGYVMNGMDRPMCVTEDYRKDLLNRFIQSTGHDILVKYIYIYTRELDARGIPWSPIVLDWHDASAIEVPDAYLEDAIEVYKWGLMELNKQLGGRVKLRGIPSYGKNMTAIKEPEE